MPTQPIIYLCKPVPVYPGKTIASASIVSDEILPKIDVVAEQEQLECIDLFSALSGRADLFPDFVHPNAEGAGLIAEQVAAAILADESDADAATTPRSK